MSDKEKLASLIWSTSKSDEGSISAMGADIVADAILAAGWNPPAFETGVSPLPGQVTQSIENMGGYDDEVRIDEGIHEATVITSMVEGKDDAHKFIIDLDMPAKLVPSTTEGHFHLYIDKEMSWTDYSDLLDSLAAAGILEEGYVGASQRRGHTTVRLPWIKKEAAPAPKPEPLDADLADLVGSF